MATAAAAPFALPGSNPIEIDRRSRLRKIEDVVPIVKFLATDGWWITGQTIFANGGYTTR